MAIKHCLKQLLNKSSFHTQTTGLSYRVLVPLASIQAEHAMSKQFGLDDRSLTVPERRISITMGYSKFFSQPDAFFLLSEKMTSY